MTVRKQLVLLAVGLVVVLVATGKLAHASLRPSPRDPEDTQPYWSPDARLVAYGEQNGPNPSARITPAGHGGVQLAVWGTPRGFRPGGTELLVQGGSVTWIVTPSGTRLGAVGGVDATWSPDGGRIAYLAGTDLVVSDVTGRVLRAVAFGISPPPSDVTGPVWSPDGGKIAIASGSRLVVANADGSGATPIADGDNPTWSPDGSAVAFERLRDGHWSIWVAAPDGSDAHVLIGGASNNRFPTWSPTGTDARIAFISDRLRIPGGATPLQFAAFSESPADGRPTLLLSDVHPFSPVRWSPTGAQLAAAAGQECLRWGVYVVRSDGARGTVRRRTNGCRLDGTPGADALHGTPFLDYIRGFGGNDTVRAGAGDDKVEGNGGNDALVGGPGNDVLFGGPGDDRISGGPGDDLIIGGNGRDRIDCGPGDDTVEAAGRLDRIARNCEHVRR